MAYQSHANFQRPKPAAQPRIAKALRRPQNFRQALQSADAKEKKGLQQGLGPPNAIRLSQHHALRKRRHSGSTINPVEALSKLRPVQPVGAIGDWD